jgi:hypothetical protein
VELKRNPALKIPLIAARPAGHAIAAAFMRRLLKCSSGRTATLAMTVTVTAQD